MGRLAALLALLALLFAAAPAAAQAQDGAGVVVIGHPGLPPIDAATAQRLYTGRSVEIAGVAVTVVALAPGSPARQRFLAAVMQQDEQRYVAYWTVRKHVGKGVPPREFASAAELLAHVQATPGTVGYMLAADLRPGVAVLLRLP